MNQRIKESNQRIKSKNQRIKEIKESMSESKNKLDHLLSYNAQNVIGFIYQANKKTY